MDNDFVRALTETMFIDNERMWDRIFKQNISALIAFIIVCIIQYGLIGSLFAGPKLFSSSLELPHYLNRLGRVEYRYLF